MLIKLDKYTSADFLHQWITDVMLDIVKSGCAGLKIKIAPYDKISQRIPSDEYLGIRCWVVPELVQKLDGAQIAQAKGKYYLVSENIQSRCGCGTSFSFEKKTIPTNLTKIHRLQNALKLSPEIQKIQKIIQTSSKK